MTFKISDYIKIFNINDYIDSKVKSAVKKIDLCDVAEMIEPRDIAGHISVSDIASNMEIDYSELSDHISIDEIADNINYKKLALALIDVAADKKSKSYLI